jgi:hypothetical protein
MARKNVHQLREFIERRAAEEGAESRDTGVSGALVRLARSQALGPYLRLSPIRIENHRAQLQDPEGVPVPADTNLSVEGRAWRPEPHRQRDEEDDWSYQYQ